MSDFFEPPEPREPGRERRYRTPQWVAPPQWTLPGLVPVELILARTTTAAICMTGIAAYPEGFEFDVRTMSASEDDPFGEPFSPGPLRARAMSEGELPDTLLRFGLQFADGAKVTNLTEAGGCGSQPPRGPVMRSGGGGGGGLSWTQSMYVWPLPPDGPLAVVVEWPAQGIALTRTELDGALVRRAASRAQVVFSDEHLPDWPDDDGEDSCQTRVIR